MSIGSRTLCVVVCGAGPAADVGQLVELAQAEGWSVFVVASPSALPFLDVEKVEALTGSPVLSAHRAPSEPRAGSAAKSTAVIVAPATFNTVNKLAMGAADTYALGVLAEAVGLGIPVVVVPFVNTVLASRLPYRRAVEQLRAEGVTVLDGHPDQGGDEARAAFPWERALRLASPAVRVGVTGHVNLTPETAVLVREAIRAVLTPYTQEGFIGVSCLAAGADTIFAEAVLALGGRLEVIIPASDYGRGRGDGFDRLVGAASRVRVMPYEVSGRIAYEAANNALLESCDRLVAVWDGRSAVDQGGTAAVVESATSRGMPVERIWPEGAARG